MQGQDKFNIASLPFLILKMENPPLWVWAIVVGIIISGKLVYRWKITRDLSREFKQDGKNVNTTDLTWSSKNYRDTYHKYYPHDDGPSRFKDYLAIMKGRTKKNKLL